VPTAPAPPAPEPVEVELTDAERVLLAVPSWDGSGTYLVPGYRFTTAEGPGPIVPAIEDDALTPPVDTATTEPPDSGSGSGGDTGAGGGADGVPEPAVEPVPPGEPTDREESIEPVPPGDPALPAPSTTTAEATPAG
jgi:hypothetical protein